MQTVLVTGSSGFIGKNLCARLALRDDIRLTRYSRDNTLDDLTRLVSEADFIFHLAGVNRPKDDNEFTTGNQELTQHIVDILRKADHHTPILLTSSTQAALDNPYGKSKLAAEETIISWSTESATPSYIYRLPGIFGKWCKPNYNSVVATFCHNIANGLPIEVSDPNNKVTLAYIDDIINDFTSHLNERSAKNESRMCDISRKFTISLGELEARLRVLHSIRETHTVPSLEDQFNKFLYATYISYLPTNKFSYQLPKNTDDRGWLSEFIKSKQFGQVFISKTKPGISRGNHWHNTKIEKFLVIHGEAEILFRNKIDDQDVISYKVNGNDLTVVDIPTGYVHSITNMGSDDLITLFWADEILDKGYPDTYFENVKQQPEVDNE